MPGVVRLCPPTAALCGVPPASIRSLILVRTLNFNKFSNTTLCRTKHVVLEERYIALPSAADCLFMRFIVLSMIAEYMHTVVSVSKPYVIVQSVAFIAIVFTVDCVLLLTVFMFLPNSAALSPLSSAGLKTVGY